MNNFDQENTALAQLLRWQPPGQRTTVPRSVVPGQRRQSIFSQTMRVRHALDCHVGGWSLYNAVAGHNYNGRSPLSLQMVNASVSFQPLQLMYLTQLSASGGSLSQTYNSAAQQPIGCSLQSRHRMTTERTDRQPRGTRDTALII
jgi:hypothetical protein